MTQIIKELRELTGAGLMDIKDALETVGEDKEKVIEYLRKKGSLKMSKKADRVANEGVVETYVHAGGKIGVMVELNCETDFVARTDDFKALAKDIALHIAAANPLYVNVEDVPTEVIEKEKEIAKESLTGKPDNVVEQILQGKVAKYLEEVALMEQSYVKDPNIKIKDMLGAVTGKLGEKISIKRFARFVLGN